MRICALAVTGFQLLQRHDSTGIHVSERYKCGVLYEIAGRHNSTKCRISDTIREKRDRLFERGENGLGMRNIAINALTKVALEPQKEPLAQSATCR